MGSMEEGARQAMNVCLDLKGGEGVTIITDRDTLEIARCLERVSRESSDDVNLFVLEDFGERPLQKVPDEIKESIRSGDVSIMVMQKRGNELHTLRKPLRILGTKHGRYANMPGVRKIVLETGMSTDHKRVWEFSRSVLETVRHAKEIRIRADNGTDLTLTIPREHRWINSNGNMRERGHSGTNLPGAEVYTCPGESNGTYVVDVEMGDYLTEKYGFLGKNPVRLEIRKGRVVNVDCINRELEKELRMYFRRDANADRVSEFALGTNPFLREYVGVFLQDEKVPGVHIAIGNPYPEATGANYSSRVHLDCITKDPTVWVDGKRIMEKGKYL